MFRNAVNLFEIFGFKIRVDPSWLLIAALIVWTLSTAYFPAEVPNLSRVDYVALGVVAMLGLFVSLILHELSHSLVARQFGLEVGGITLFIFGGVAELEQEPQSPASEFWIAIAGPAMSLLLAGFCYLLLFLIAGDGVSGSVRSVLTYLGFINLVLAIFNLVPAFPLDGGRVLRAALWHFQKDLLRATRIASFMGSSFGLLLILSGVLSLFSTNLVGGFWQILIGFFIISASRGSYGQLLVKAALRDQSVRVLMTAAPVTADVGLSVQRLVDEIMLPRHVSFVPVMEGEHLLGFVDMSLVREIDRENWPATRLGDILVVADSGNTVDPDTPTEDLFRRMAGQGQRKWLVARNGRLEGVISLSDLLSYLAIKQGLGLPDAAGR